MVRTLTQVVIRELPDTIDWLFDDGGVETTHDDISTVAGRLAIASRAETLGLGQKKSLFEHLGGRDGYMNGTGVIFCRRTGIEGPGAAAAPSSTPTSPRK